MVKELRRFRVKTFLFLLSTLSIVRAASPELEKAQKLYNLTDFEGSLRILNTIQPRDASVNTWIGRNFYMQTDYKRASEALEKAFAQDPSSSEIALWAGRAFGRRAETSSMFTAPGYASKARAYFEKSVHLNPRNLEALADLFEYYLEAPGFLGGGFDKAQATSRQIAQIDAAEGHFTQARLAEKRKQFRGTEEHLRRAVEAAPQQIGRLIDLARFLAKEGRLQESDQNLATAEKLNPNSPKLLYAKADLYIKQNRNLDVAKDLLKRYLTSNLTPDDPPRSDAEKLLKQLGG
jgi:tetratricopeptide (TPR) repeat protein